MEKKYYWGRIFAIIGALYIFLKIWFGVKASSSSTAAIGLIAIPVLVPIFCLIFGFAGFCLSLYLKKRHTWPLTSYLLLIPAICIPCYFIYDEIYNIYTCNKTENLRNLSYENLELQMKNLPKDGLELAAILENPNVTSGMLDKIAKINNPLLYQSQGSSYSCINGKNRKGLSVMRLITLHENVTTETLEYLAMNTEDQYLLGDLVQNPKISESTQRRIYNAHKHDQYPFLLFIGITSNPATPNDILVEVWGFSDDQYVRSRIIRNPNLPVELLDYMVANTDNKLVLEEAVQNPSLSSESLRKIYNDHKTDPSNSRMMYFLAANPKTPNDILIEMWNTNDPQFRHGINRNPNFQIPQ